MIGNIAAHFSKQTTKLVTTGIKEVGKELQKTELVKKNPVGSRIGGLAGGVGGACVATTIATGGATIPITAAGIVVGIAAGAITEKTVKKIKGVL